MIRVYFVEGWSRPDAATSPDVVARDPEELLALADGTATHASGRRLAPAERAVLRAVAGQLRAGSPVDVIASPAVYQILPRTGA